LFPLFAFFCSFRFPPGEIALFLLILDMLATAFLMFLSLYFYLLSLSYIKLGFNYSI
jgi:hypothetical protein